MDADKREAMEQRTRARQFMFQARAIARLVDRSDAEASFKRARGDCICPVCQLPYFDHPQLKENYLTLTCEGEWLHL